MQRYDWDDIRVILAILDQGSLSAAGRALGVNHATVLRRLDGFEERLGVTLFRRHARGLSPVPGRERIFAAMHDMEAGALAVGRGIEAARSPLAGVVRITSTDTFCLSVLPRLLAGLQQQVEGLRIELCAANAHADLARLEADIAVRPAQHSPAGMVADQAGDLGMGVYAAPGGSNAWLGLSGRLQEVSSFASFFSGVQDRDFAAWADSFPVLREMAAQGQGRALLPCVLGDAENRLVRLADPEGLPRPAIWVVALPDMADVPRIQVVRRMLTEALWQDRSELNGSSAGLN